MIPIRLLPDFCFSNGLVRFGVLAEEPLTSGALRARPLWSILTLLGIRVGVVNWPLTYPAPIVRGYVVSDRYVRPSVSVSGGADPAVVYPPELLADMTPVSQASLIDPQAIVPVGTTTTVAERHQLPGRADRLYEQVAQWLETAQPVQVTITRYQSLDPIGHYFLRYATPQEFGNVSEDDRRRFGQILESHYGFIDEAIGRAMAALGPDDLLLVVSGYGMEPLGFGKRAARAAARRSGRERHPRRRAGRIPDGVRGVGGEAPPAAPRLDRRRRADGAVFPRPADRPRHGRLRADRHLSAVVHRRAPDHVHPDL